MRALQRARDGAERARIGRDQAVAARSALAERMSKLNAAAARTAGRLGMRDHYRAQLRSQLDAAGERVNATGRVLREATNAIEAAQRQVEQALRSRDAAEAQRDADDKADARKKERRAQAASDDHWRPPRRG